MNQLCEMKGIKRKFSISRTPQQNGVAERKNRTLIEAARTMLADSKLRTTFWAEAVNTACYDQNRVLVIKPHNKTPYKLFLGRKPALSFMSPFGCPIIILNTIDHLGKFDGKVDEGFFVGYSTNSKAFRVFNNALTKSMNYEPVVAGNQSNGIADPPFSSSLKDSPDAGFKPSGEEEKKDAKHLENEDSEVTNTEEPRVNQEQHESVNSTNNINTVSLTVNTASIKDNAVDENIVYGCAYDPNMPNLEEIVYSEDDEGVGVEYLQFSTSNQKYGKECDLTWWIEVCKKSVLQYKLQQVWTLVDLPYGKRAIGTKWVHRNKKDKKGIIIRNKVGFGCTGVYTQKQGIRLDEMDVKSAFCYGKIERKFRLSKNLQGLDDPEFHDHRLQVTQKDDGIFIIQDKYVDEILKKFGFSTGKTTSTPMETLKSLMKDKNTEDVDFHLYRSMIGSLMYLTSSRPNIMFGVCACARFQVTPKVSHLHAVKRIFKYLKGQPKLSLWYPKDSPFDLEAYTDSDYAGASLDRKSTTGGCQFLGSRLISWQYKKQTIVANSTTETKYVAASNCCRQVVNAKDEIGVKTENADFDEMVDFLNANPIWIFLNSVFNDEYDTYTYTKKVFANMRRQEKDFSGAVTPLFPSMLASQAVEGKGSGQPSEPQHTPTIASPSYVVPIPTVASSSHPKKTHKHRKTKRKATEISQSSGPTTLVVDETLHEERGDSVERAATTTASLDAEQDSVNTHGSGEDSMELNELMEICTRLSERVLTLENIKTAQNLEIINLKKRVKKLEKKKKVRTLQLKRMLFKVKIKSSAKKSLGDQEDVSKEERNGIDQDEEISWFKEDVETQGRYGHDFEVNNASTSITTTSINITTAESVTTASAPVTTPYKLIYGKNCHLPFQIEHHAYWALKNCNPDLIAAGEKRMF
ncbi:retrovirus-related pol polyprotein from transposon TNT 1-94 [Tanacetum coccineum]